MIYVHCGWPKTGTSTLQAALVKNEDVLRLSGVGYPKKLRRRIDGSHNDLIDLLRSSEEAGPLAFQEFKEHLSARREEKVLLSSESLTDWLMRARSFDALLDLFGALREVAPVRCIWTLRRLDDLIMSAYLHLVSAGLADISVDHLLSTFRADRLFNGMRKLEEAVEGDAVYVRYDPGGNHYPEVLRAFGLSSELTKIVEQGLNAGPRFNASHSQKEIVAILKVDELSTKVGITLDRPMLIGAFRAGFRFEHDRACVPGQRTMRVDLQGRALEAASANDFTPYIQFFGNAEIEGVTSDISDIELLTDEDLVRLVAHLQREVHLGRIY